MSQTPLVQRKVINNSSGLLTNVHAYSPNLPVPSKQEAHNKPENASQSDSIEKILSTSIQRAKQKITMLEGKQRQQRGQNRQERFGSKEGHTNNPNNAIAAAMKVLQSRVSELQCSIQNHQRERAILLKQLDSLTDQKKIILANLQQANVKMSTLEQSNRSFKAEIKDYSKRLEESQNSLVELQAKCKTLEMNIKHLQQDKHQLNTQFARRQQEIASRSSSSQKQLASKAQETEEKERLIHEKEKKLNEREKRLIEFENSLRERKENKQLQEKRQLNQLIKQNEDLRNELALLKRHVNEETQSHIYQKNKYEIDLNKLKELQMEINILRQTTKNLEEKEFCNTERNQEEIDQINHQNRNLRNQNEDLLYQFKRAQDRIKRQEKQNRMIKERTRELEDLLTQIIEKISKLVNCPKDLKYLTVKAGKLIHSPLQRINTLKTPTKSRSNSLNRSLSRSNSQRKNTQQSQITNSRHSKSKQKSSSKGKRKEESANKTRKVVVSQTGTIGTDKQVAELKKQYKRLVKVLDETENEQIRNKLNEIAFAIQERNEKATKMRQANRLK